LLPAASFACNVSASVAPEATLGVAAVIRDWLKESAPGVTTILGAVLVTAAPPMVAPMFVATPANTPVKVAV
jgi:hypothetical protein